MAEQDRISDQGIYAVVDKVIQDLLPFDPNSRLRVYRTVGTFFGFEDSYLKVAENMDGRVPANLLGLPCRLWENPSYWLTVIPNATHLLPRTHRRSSNESLQVDLGTGVSGTRAEL